MARDNVTGTAFIIAAFRAEENRAPAPLYTDHFVEPLLADGVCALADEIAQNFPQAREMVKLRTRYFDDALLAALEQGMRQVVILGAGLDMRAARFPRPGLRYVEIDSAATLTLKREGLARQGVSPEVTYLPGDYVRDGVVGLLHGGGVDLAAPTFVLWEGNTTLLPRAAVEGTLASLRDGLATFRLALDYMSDRVIARTTGYDDISDYIDRYERTYNTRWLTGFESIGPLATSLGLRVVEEWTTAELLARYRPQHRLDSNIFKFYRVSTLAKE